MAAVLVAEGLHCAEPGGQEGRSTHGFELVVNPMPGKEEDEVTELEATDAEYEQDNNAPHAGPASGAVQVLSLAKHVSTRRREKERKGTSWCQGYRVRGRKEAH